MGVEGKSESNWGGKDYICLKGGRVHGGMERGGSSRNKHLSKRCGQEQRSLQGLILRIVREQKTKEGRKGALKRKNEV